MSESHHNPDQTNNRASEWEKSPTIHTFKRQRLRQGISTEISPKADLVSLAEQRNLPANNLKRNHQFTPPERELWSSKINRKNLQMEAHQIQQNYIQKINQESDCLAGPSCTKNIDYAFITKDQRDPPCEKWKLIFQSDTPSDDSMFGPDFAPEDLEKLDFLEKQSINPSNSQQAKEVVNNQQNQNSNNDDDDDMFGDDFPSGDLDKLLFEMEDVQKESAKQNEPIFKAPDPSPLNNQKEAQLKIFNGIKKRYRRCIILDIFSQGYNTSEMANLPEKVLVLMDNDENKPVHAHVRQDWLETILCIGDTIHIPLNGKDRPLSIIIDNENNYIITCPDNLIPITTIVNSFICLRKSVLQQKNARSMKYTQALVHGDIMHQVFQYGLKTSDFSEDGLCIELMRVIKASLIPLSAIDQDEEEAFAIMKGDLGAIKAFGDIYIGPEPKPDATLSDNVDKQFKRKLDIDTISISRVLDIEENLWSPTYGIKGMIDATIQLETSPDKKTLIIPFELKTGKGTKDIFHCAQTLLYTLLMSDRYDIPIDLGALFYSRSNRLFLLPALRNELMSLIITRNDLAFALEQETLPPMIKSLHNCQNCDMANTCLTNHKAIEGGNGITSGLDGWFDKNTDQLTLEDAAFFRHWHKLIDLEEDNSNYMRKDIWIQPAELRELNGTCLNNMRMKIPLNSENGRFTRSFYRDPEYQVDKSIKELSDSQIEHGDTVIISSIDGHVNLGSGTVVSIGPENIVIRFYNPLRRAPKKDLLFDEASNQVFEKILPDAINNDFYRIDKDFLPSGLGVLRQNIVTLVSKEENGGDEKRKRLIVDLATPAFINNSSAPPHSIPGLNSDQQLAVNKVLSAKDYALILGMPGTGKTTTTAHIIKELVARNKTVLVAAYTHIAIDNVLMKVKQSGVEVLRIGKYAQVAPELRDSMVEYNPELDSVQAIRDFYDSRKVVGVTCLGIKNSFFYNRKFDYCIIDEASQITLPVCVGPLRYADTFVLVGDQYQLSPVIKNNQANNGGLGKSLFNLLAEAHPQSIVYLKYQYRMNKDIMQICNTFVYDNKLKCGSNAIAASSLEIPRINQVLDEIHQPKLDEAKGISLCSGSPCWLKDILDPSRKVVFVDTDALEGKEERPLSGHPQNPTELKLIHQIVQTMLGSGIKVDQLGVISVYRSQLRAAAQCFEYIKHLEISTIDRYQGRDKDCIIISLVRNNPQKQTGDLLKDWKRINVAMTRAKKKMILIGSESTLDTFILFKRLLAMLRANNWIYKLPQNADISHSIPQNDQINKTKKSKIHITPNSLRSKAILADYVPETS